MTVHVIGAGVAGLACAVRLASQGVAVRLWEAAGHAGGRCRSYEDAQLGCRIDNGNHLILTGNGAVMAYLAAIGGLGELTGPARAEFPFLDLTNGERWTVAPGPGQIPWWILDPARRIPGTRPRDYLAGLRLAFAAPAVVVDRCVDPASVLYRRFWEPLAVAALNTAPSEATARLLWPVLAQTFGRGEAACRPRTARHGLSETFVDPALAKLAKWGAKVSLNRRCRALEFNGGRVSGLDFGDRHAVLESGDGLVLAVPPTVAADLLPGLVAPTDFRAIVNGHFLLPAEVPDLRIIGLIGGVGHWVFARGDVASVTVSAADALAEEPAEAIADRLWPEVRAALDLGALPLPAYRIVKEKRATFAQTPEQEARRPETRTARPNVWLAGDWTRTGLPATLEGAIRSGFAAADAAWVTK